MNRTRLSEYIVLSISAYITIIGVYFVLLPNVDTAVEQLVLTLLFLFFSVLAGLFFRFENNGRIVNFLLGLKTAVLLTIFFFTGYDLDVGTLFFVMSAYAMLFLPVRRGILWILLFTLIVGVLGYIFDGASNLTTLISMGGGFAFFGFVGASLRRSDAARRESDRLLGELQQAHEQLQEYAAQVEQLAVAEERNRLAREMHDALGHRLTVAVVQLEGAQRLIPTEPDKAANMVGTMREQLKMALQELRQTVSALRISAEADLPLPEAIQRLVTNFQVATGLPVHLDLPVEMPALPSSHRLTLFRAIQEGLTNVQRHAEAGQIWLELAAHNGAVTLVIADDGKGFPEVIGDGRFGLEGLRERTKQLGGSVYLENREGGGAKIRLQIPVDTYNGVG
jgi:signal transduction histidine kinase